MCEIQTDKVQKLKLQEKAITRNIFLPQDVIESSGIDL